MKKRNITFAILLIAVVLTAVGVSGTYARYITSDSAVGTTNIAKWSVEFEGDGRETTGDKRIIVPLALDTNTHVATGVIAPGSTATGTLKVDLSGTEVDADIYVEVVGLKIDGVSIDSYKNRFNISLLDKDDQDIGEKINVPYTSNTDPVDVNVQLEWKNDDDDMTLEERLGYTWNEWDTGKGEASAQVTGDHSKIEVELKVVVQQHVSTDD